jgi:hypothetical protein
MILLLLCVKDAEGPENELEAEEEKTLPKKPKLKWEPSEALKKLQSSQEYNPFWKIEMVLEIIKQEKGEDVCVIDLRNKVTSLNTSKSFHNWREREKEKKRMNERMRVRN